MGVEWPGRVLRERIQKTRCSYMVPFDAMTIVSCLFSPKNFCELYNLSNGNSMV